MLVFGRYFAKGSSVTRIPEMRGLEMPNRMAAGLARCFRSCLQVINTHLSKDLGFGLQSFFVWGGAGGRTAPRCLLPFGL